MPEEDSGAGEMQQAQEVVDMTFPARDETTRAVEPREEPFDLPASARATERTAILRGPSTPPVCLHFERRASLDARTHRGVGRRPRRAARRITRPSLMGSLPLTAIPRAARRTGRSLSRGARAAMPPSVPPPSAAA